MVMLTTANSMVKAKPENSRTNGSPLVLVVDDHADTRDMLRVAIELKGCRVVEASDGEEAVLLAERTLPNLILMDTSLPKVDGYMATERIRKIESVRSVPILFLSGHAEAPARDLALAAGGDGYFVKPIDLEELGSALMKYLTTRESVWSH
jgi:two-component system, OmpR family, phosphate regulon response regulator PhoB